MKGFNVICPLFISCVISSCHSSSDSSGGASNGLGIAICDTWSYIQSKCGTEDVPVENFPKECTSFFYTGLDLTNGTAVDPYAEEKPKGYLDSLLSLNKPVTIMVSRDNWADALKSVQQDGAETEMANMKTYMEGHNGITGMALYNIELDTTDIADPEYTQKLICYIGILKKNFPGMKIGLYFNSGTIIDTMNSEQLKSLDLACLNENVDFFRILSATDVLVGECASSKYYHGDVVWNAINKKVEDWIEGFKIPKEKVIWDVYGTPTNFNLTDCDLTYTNMCLNPNGIFCAETQQILYKRAKHIKEIAGGFAILYIDMDDANCGCQCARNFPVFYALWDGFNGNSVPGECCLMDRPNI